MEMKMELNYKLYNGSLNVACDNVEAVGLMRLWP